MKRHFSFLSLSFKMLTTAFHSLNFRVVFFFFFSCNVNMMCLCIDLWCAYFVLCTLGCVGLMLSVWNTRVQYFSILFFPFNLPLFRTPITWCDELNCKPQNTCLPRILDCDVIWNKGLWMYNWATISRWSHNKYRVFPKSNKRNSFNGKRATRTKKDKGKDHVKTERDWSNALS